MTFDAAKGLSALGVQSPREIIDTQQTTNKQTMRIGTRLIDLSKPSIMGILNCTPDSFYAPSRLQTGQKGVEAACLLAEKHLQEGACCLDIGGYSSRPGATVVSEKEEMQRVLPVIRALVRRFPEALLCIDTFRASVVAGALEAGAHMVNDISGGELDADMFSTVARYGVPYVLMHLRGTPQTMATQTEYQDVVAEVFDFLRQRLATLRALGCADVLIDVGIGFAKLLPQNYQLLQQLSYFQALQAPIMVGVSRKSLIYKLLDISPKEALLGTTALHLWALTQGASWLRVHDVAAAKQAVLLFQALYPRGLNQGDLL